ncbi:MAG: hypothetical protein ACI4JI_06080 [Ruminiclostridium sp.]
MVNNVLSLLRPELALNMQSEDFACGTYVGYGFTLKAMNEKSCIVFNSWAKSSALTSLDAESYFKQIMALPENSFIKAYRVTGSNISAVLFVNDDEKQAVTDIKRFITELVKYYSSNYYSNSCAKCGSSIGLSFGNGGDGNIRQYCKMCMQPSDLDQASVAAVQNNSFVQPSVEPVEQPQQPQNVGIYGIPVSAQTTVSPVQPADNTMNTVNPNTVPSGNGYQGVDSINGLQPQNNTNIPPMNSGYTQQPVPQPQQFGQQPVQMGVYGIPVDAQVPMQPNTAMDSIDPKTAPSSTGYSTAESLAQLQPPNNKNLPPIDGGFSQPSYNNQPMNGGGYVQQPMNTGFVQQSYSNNNDARFIAGRPTAIEPEGNPILGILGAVLFSLIGCAVWVVIGKLGYISYIGGVAMSFTTLFGYYLFSKKFDIIGMITGIVIVLLMVLFANMIICAWNIWGYTSDPNTASALSYLGYDSFFSVLFGLFDLMKELDLRNGLEGVHSFTGTFIENLVISYVICGISTCAIGIPMLKKNR